MSQKHRVLLMHDACDTSPVGSLFRTTYVLLDTHVTVYGLIQDPFCTSGRCHVCFFCAFCTFSCFLGENQKKHEKSQVLYLPECFSSWSKKQIIFQKYLNTKSTCYQGNFDLLEEYSIMAVLFKNSWFNQTNIRVQIFSFL